MRPDLSAYLFNTSFNRFIRNLVLLTLVLSITTLSGCAGMKAQKRMDALVQVEKDRILLAAKAAIIARESYDLNELADLTAVLQEYCDELQAHPKSNHLTGLQKNKDGTVDCLSANSKFRPGLSEYNMNHLGGIFHATSIAVGYLHRLEKELRSERPEYGLTNLVKGSILELTAQAVAAVQLATRMFHDADLHDRDDKGNLARRLEECNTVRAAVPSYLANPVKTLDDGKKGKVNYFYMLGYKDSSITRDTLPLSKDTGTHQKSKALDIALRDVWYAELDIKAMEGPLARAKRKSIFDSQAFKTMSEAGSIVLKGATMGVKAYSQQEQRRIAKEKKEQRDREIARYEAHEHAKSQNKDKQLRGNATSSSSSSSDQWSSRLKEMGAERMRLYKELGHARHRQFEAANGLTRTGSPCARSRSCNVAGNTGIQAQRPEYLVNKISLENWRVTQADIDNHLNRIEDIDRQLKEHNATR